MGIALGMLSIQQAILIKILINELLHTSGILSNTGTKLTNRQKLGVVRSVGVQFALNDMNTVAGGHGSNSNSSEPLEHSLRAKMFL